MTLTVCSLFVRPQAWAERLCCVAPQLKGQGPIYFLWGTDWEDAPVVNACALDSALPPGMRANHRRVVAAQPHTIMSMLARMPRRAVVGAHGDGGHTSQGTGSDAGGQVCDHVERGHQGPGGDAGYLPPSEDPSPGPGATAPAKRRCLGWVANGEEHAAGGTEQAGTAAPASVPLGGEQPDGKQKQGGGMTPAGTSNSRAGTQRKLSHYFSAKPPSASKAT